MPLWLASTINFPFAFLSPQKERAVKLQPMSPLQKNLLMLCAMCLATQAGFNLIKYFHELSDGSHFGGDFIGFWNAAHRVRHGDIVAIYDPDTWHRIFSTNTAGIISFFVYPPFTLFGLWPLGDATYHQAVLAWFLPSLA